ncbi:enoyl-CoA hydratase/isomerase family protein [Aneurinibacillus thermoaerophilus]|uniref:Enoyl-CoA hydratase/carnithine racemase n=1 Tax=Aneurinibacillus thermoaerophilus TaxID=143495 RepID=A0A1G7W7A5_ANETH|nr:enoyl-CoA hydratase/isomerase family protein [Aneurinibacillus thermoaerophilus]MED0674740.1 enoyl-CoA hydratase/isomerase family protein [Aneurinibacillus thermoaerophilus]MED0680223.1 enoyl-CoA hydratase/isomerase family protein [Aneurinibacillus thermoaerophilus]MED0756669.1 enoyl-CoA hydratase/isomerase family protein [Aneurinibacillus thermoaerophilus]MED0760719.1 enoyl-CoA hydratase/isomerase family protein [Aneurinibacillus thermoaerophilus]MED0764665.1 enoyl-CoA hydratase/isomerase 
MNTILVDRQGGIALVTLNRPEVRNAISFEMVEELDKCLDELAVDREVKVVIFTGSGDKAFVSGGDLDQFLSVRTKDKSHPMLMRVARLLSKIDRYPKPTIAMINGAAIGGGCEFAVACRFRMASDRARMGFVQIGMHIITGWGSGTRLMKKIGTNRALALLLTGEMFDAAYGKEVGFIDRVFPHEKLREEVFGFAAKIAEKPLCSIEAYMKVAKMVDSGLESDVCIEEEVDLCSSLWGSDAHYGIVQKFLRKK